MADLIEGIVTDDADVPVPGAKVYVYADGVLAALKDALGASVANPIVADSLGFYSAYVTYSIEYRLDYYYLGKVRERDVHRNDAGVAAAAAAAAASAAAATLAIDLQSAALSGASGSSLVGFLASPPSAVARTAQDKMRETISVKDFGAKGNGTTDDSAAFVAAVAAGGTVLSVAGQNCAIKDITLSNGQTLTGFGSILKAFTGAVNLVKLLDYAPHVSDYYLSDTTACSEAAFRIGASRYAMLDKITGVNGGPGFVRLEPASPTTTAVALPQINNCQAEDITGTGLLMGSSVSELRSTNLHLYGKLQASTGGTRPSFTSVGWRQNTPVLGGFAVGGHQITSANMIAFNRGFHLTDAQLSKFTNCIADSCCDYGVLIDGASQKIRFADLYVGTTRGIKIAGSSEVWIDGLETILNGTIPPWGSTDFYNGVSTFYDVEVRGTAILRISNWKGDKRIAVDSTAKLIIDGAIRLPFRSTGTIGAAASGFLCEWGSTSDENGAGWRATCDGHLVGFYVATTAAPGASQTFTYTARINGADTALIGVATGAGAFSTEQWCGVSPVAVSKGDLIAQKIVTSAGAGVGYHNGALLFLPS